MAAFNRFAAIIRGLEVAAETRIRARDASGAMGCAFVFLAFGIFNILAAVSPLGILFWGGLALGFYLYGLYKRRRPVSLPAHLAGWDEAFAQHEGAAELLEELRGFERQRMLGERTHPEFLVLLERAARAVDRVQKACQEEGMRSLPQDDEWRQVMEGSLRASRDSLVDCLWMGRHLFRRKNQRTTTFERNCADPDWGAAQLKAVEAVVEDLEQLAANLSGDLAALHANRTPLQRSLAHLQERHEAQSELDEDAGESVVRLMD